MEMTDLVSLTSDAPALQVAGINDQLILTLIP
jgi:hypothetical protein